LSIKDSKIVARIFMNYLFIVSKRQIFFNAIEPKLIIVFYNIQLTCLLLYSTCVFNSLPAVLDSSQRWKSRVIGIRLNRSGRRRKRPAQNGIFPALPGDRDRSEVICPALPTQGHQH